MKKALAVFIAAVVSLHCAAFAADAPTRLYGVEKFENAEELAYNERADEGEAVALPGQTDGFTYSFASAETQYSDFVFVPMTPFTGVYIEIVGEKEHDVTMTLMQGSAEIFSEPVTVSGSPVTMIVNYYELEPLKPYYIRLQSDSLNGASGKVKVWGVSAEEDGEKPEPISRGEFSVLLAELLELDTDGAGGAEEFGDIGEHNYPYGAVMRLRELGIVKGVGDNTFDYQAKITYAQAFCMAARLFVTDEEIEAKAPDRPYPIGSTVICSELGLSKGIDVNIDDEVTQAGCKLLFDNIREKYADIRIFGDTPAA